MEELYIGLMSGTSLDGVDGVLVDLDTAGDAPLRVLSHAHEAFGADLAHELLALNTAGTNELQRAALAANALAGVGARVVDRLIGAYADLRTDVRAIGTHGQTLRHAPGEFDAIGFTLQINQPALLAELTGIDVIADFRSRDVAAGGQGAPLAPAFHRAVFGRAGATVAVLNLGGISNLTLLGADRSVLGFDCGPGNVLMDDWCRRHTGEAFDDGGSWAASGRVLPVLLNALRSATPYFAAPAPKSTGRDLFNPAWLAQQLAALGAAASQARPQDIQATLAELTASVCADDLLRLVPRPSEVIVCGGGAFNLDLKRRLAARLGGIPVVSSRERGLPPTQVEACAFAWLARAFVRREPGNLRSVTGARGPRVLGALYPAA